VLDIDKYVPYINGVKFAKQLLLFFFMQTCSDPISLNIYSANGDRRIYKMYRTSVNKSSHKHTRF
jgi:hypothetical protein